jgi:uncharacterized protein YjbI with pentapeptide repeats
MLLDYLTWGLVRVPHRAKLRDDLRRATLIDSRLARANLTGAKLWETQRGGGSIKGVISQRAFWNRNGKEPTEYGVSDFERIGFA